MHNPSEARRIVSVPRGSWRWQDAYRVSVYHPHKTRDGRLVWQHSHYLGSRRKYSLPQLRGMGHGHLPIGGLHNSPIA